jgi:hypothetical protein
MIKLTIHFLNGNDNLTQAHYYQKEYRNDIIVEINSLFYEIYFYTSNAIDYEITDQGFFSYPGIIILDEITTDKIFVAVEKLYEKSYFKWFKGSLSMPIESSFIQNWLLNRISFDTSKIYSVTCNF